MGMMILAMGLAAYAWFAHQPRTRLAFAVSEARLRQDARYAAWANNIEGEAQ